VVEENLARISKYPDLPLDPDIREEVRRLAGGLSALAGSAWHDLGRALQDTMYDMTSSEMLTLDSKLRYLSSPDRQETPGFLNRLLIELRRFPRNYPAIEREEKDYILEVSFFLHDLCTVLERVKRVYTEMPDDRRAMVESAFARTTDLIADFRLKDLKRSR
jgi:hypothetical protein